MKKLKITLLIIFITISFNAFTQSGPTVPACVNCEQHTKRVTPLNGLWYNPEQSGVGISIELQKNTLFGTYYGYDDAGHSVWYTFLGELTPSTEPGVMWNFESPLKQFENGTCINCNYIPPVATEFNSVLKIQFKQTSFATFSIDDGSSQNIVPLVFRTNQSAEFTDITSYKFPDLSGQWVFVYNLNIWPTVKDTVGRPQMIAGTEGFVTTNEDGTTKIIYYLLESGISEHLNIGWISCETSLDEKNNIIGPSCLFHNIIFSEAGPEIFYFSIGGLGANRIFGESEAGHSFTGIKLDMNADHPN